MKNRNLSIPHDICIISSYATTNPDIEAFLNRLNAALAARGIQLVVLTTQKNENLQSLFIEVPYLLSGFDHVLADTEAQTPFHPVLPTLLSERDNSANFQEESAVGRGISKCEDFYRAIGTLMAPCAALLWNTTLPHSRIARNTLMVTGVPAYCIERGWLPQSYQLHSTENNGFNDFFTDFTLNQSLPRIIKEYGAFLEPFKQAQQYYLAEGIQKYDAGVMQSPHSLREKYGIGKETLVVCFAGSEGASVGTHHMPSMAYSSPLFEGVSQGLDILARLLKPYTNVRVLVQEHPIQRAINKPAILPKGFISTVGENIHTLLNAADRLAFIGTTTVQAEALLLNKPRLSMSRHVASLAGASYGLVEEGDSAVTAWMENARLEECSFAARALVNYLCKERLIRDEPLPEFVRYNIDDLANFIANLSRPNQVPANERIAVFVNRVSGMLKQH